MQTTSSKPYPTIYYKRSVGVFPDRKALRQALYDLRASGFPMAQVSLIARDADSTQPVTRASEQPRVVEQVEEGTAMGALSGGALGTLTGLLVGLGLLALPGIGPVMLAGATATALTTTLAGGAIGAVTGGLLGALIALGIPESHAKLYHDRVASGDCLVFVDGTDAEIAIAERIARRHGVEEYRVYAKPVTDQVAPIPASSSSFSRMVQPLPAQTLQNSSPYQSGGIDLTRSKYGVGVFSEPSNAELAINDLRLTQFPLPQVCLITQMPEQFKFLTDVAVRDRIDAMRLGMPVEHARFYNDQLNQANLILMINGTEPELHQAAAVLSQRDIQAWQMYDPTAIDATLSAEPDSSPALSSLTASPTPTQVPLPPSPHPSTPVPEVVFQPELVEVVAVPQEIVLPTSRFVAQPQPEVIPQQEVMIILQKLQQAEAVLTKLQAVHFPMQQTSILAKHNSLKIPTKLGGLVVGIGKLDIPGIGPVLVEGASATRLVAAVLAEGAASATEGLTRALVERGISHAKAKIYTDHLLQGSLLIMVNGVKEELLQVETVLQPQEFTDWDVYPSPELN